MYCSHHQETRARLIGLVGRVFANSPGDLSLLPGRVIPKTLKMVLDTFLLNTQQYKVHNKVKWSNPGKGVVPSPSPWCSNCWKGSLRVAFDYGRQLLHPQNRKKLSSETVPINSFLTKIVKNIPCTKDGFILLVTLMRGWKHPGGAGNFSARTKKGMNDLQPRNARGISYILTNIQHSTSLRHRCHIVVTRTHKLNVSVVISILE